ncbi:hypothetical protein GJ496_005368 [Pomphorhynchus laevis]|nr:hypothetical protein GJ496_005368 [Pomphorhynchus laevis]
MIPSNNNCPVENNLSETNINNDCHSATNNVEAILSPLFLLTINITLRKGSVINSPRVHPRTIHNSFTHECNNYLNKTKNCISGEKLTSYQPPEFDIDSNHIPTPPILRMKVKVPCPAYKRKQPKQRCVMFHNIKKSNSAVTQNRLSHDTEQIRKNHCL